VKLIDLIKEHGWQIFSSSDGSCPCGNFSMGDMDIEIHCWRSSCPKGCPYACIHMKIGIDVVLKEAKELGNEIRKQVEEAYRCECKLIVEKKDA